MRASAFLIASVVGIHASVGLAGPFEVRVIERTGQVAITPANNVVDLAVQVRAPAGSMIGGFSFSISMPGESESFGTLARGRISNFDGTYFSGFSQSSAIGVGGIARQFHFLAAINPAFNGSINGQGGVVPNRPSQDISLVTGFCGGPWLLETPHVDTDFDGNPDTWSGNGTNEDPDGATASVPAASRGPYFADGEFIDVYRFRYTVSNLNQPRPIRIELLSLQLYSFTEFLNQNGGWGVLTTPVQSVASSPLTLYVPTPGSAVVAGFLSGHCLFRRRR